MKRIVSLFLFMALAIGAVTYKPPQAKAVVFEGAALGSLYGSVMGSMGLTYAACGMNNQSFGLAIWDLMTSWYTDMTPEGESASEFFGNLASAGIQAMAPGQVLLNQSLIDSILQFSEWLYDKYALDENESAVVSGDVLTFTGERTNYRVDFPFSIYTYNSLSSSYDMALFCIDNITVPGIYTFKVLKSKTSGTIWFDSVAIKVGGSFIETDAGDSTNPGISNGVGYSATWTITDEDIAKGAVVQIGLTTDIRNISKGLTLPIDGTCILTLGDSPILSISAPNGLTISDVEAVTPEQAYALTFEGVTATDVEGIVNEAVGRILDGTYSAAGEITDALDVPQELTWQEHIAQIWENIKALPETIGNAVKSAFEPDPELVTEITTTFTDKFGWLETIHQLGLDLCGLKPGSEPPVIFIHLEDATGKYNYGGTEKALDMSWYEPYKEDVDNIISGFMWLAFLWLVFKRAADIINGAGMVSDYEFYGSHPIDQPRLEEHKK